VALPGDQPAVDGDAAGPRSAGERQVHVDFSSSRPAPSRRNRDQRLSDLLIVIGVSPAPAGPRSAPSLARAAAT
jgi:hypothetical protein